MHLWGWFIDLSGTRTVGMAAANPISFLEIFAWAWLTGTAPTPWEVDMLRRMDTAALAASHKATPSAASEPRQIDASDGREVLGFMRSLGARKETVSALA